MFNPKIIIALLLAGFCSCTQKRSKHKINPAAIELNKQAISLVSYIQNPDSARKAISLLDKATSIDSNFFLGYSNKIMFYNQLKQFDKAVATVNKLLQFRPSDYSLYATGGIYYEYLGDTAASKSYFHRSMTLCNDVLNTIDSNNKSYESVIMIKGIDFIMLGDSLQGNRLLKKYCDSQKDIAVKSGFEAIMNKNKKQLLKLFIND